MSNFKIGQKVICINTSLLLGNAPLKLNTIYTITGITGCKVCNTPSLILKNVRVENVLGRTCTKCKNIGPNIHQFAAWRFRPLIEQPDKITNVLNNEDIIKELVEEKVEIKEKELV